MVILMSFDEIKVSYGHFSEFSVNYESYGDFSEFYVNYISYMENMKNQ